MDFGPFLFLATLEGLVMAAVLALTAAGLSLVFGVMRVVNVAHGEFFMLGAVLAWTVAHLLANPALGFLAALVVSPLVAALIAVALDRVILRRLNYEPEAVIVATIGFGYILQQGALSFYGPDARAVAAPFAWQIQLPWFGYSGYKLAVIAFAALFIGLSDGIISVFFSPTLAKILATLLVALVLVFRPQGLFGRRPA